MKQIAVISGANRGIGLEVSRQLARRGVHVVMTSRDEAKGRAATEALRVTDGLSVSYHPLDVTREESIRALAEHLKAEHGGLDILVNNAGIALDGFNAEVARTTIEVNFFGPLHLTEALLPLIRKSGRIVMISSGVGDRSRLSSPLKARFSHIEALTREEIVGLMRQFVTDVEEGKHAAAGWPSSAYAVSKIGLNALTVLFAKELAKDGRGILCNAVCPGWVRTDMGGPGASRSLEQGAETPVWLALEPPGTPSGAVFRDKTRVSF